MRREQVGCVDVRVELSARLDGEQDRSLESAVEEHLSGCAECRAHDTALKRVRGALRVQGATEVPDLGRAIADRLELEGAGLRRRNQWRSGARIAGVAAVAAAVLLLATSLPFRPDQPSSANASEVAERVRAAARVLDTYRASFRIVERNYQADVPVRRFAARVWFKAPERFRLQVSDLTAYPSADWPANEVRLVASPTRWWIEEPTICPSEAMGRCPYTSTETRDVSRRQPFDGATALPTDIIVPLETLATTEDFQVLGTRTIAGRNALRVALLYRQAVPLVSALEAGGAWREFYPLDRVDLWIDAETLFPLRFEVSAHGSTERMRWARTKGYTDQAGESLLTVHATRMSEPELHEGLFRAPRQAELPRSGGFRQRAIEDTTSWIAPADTAGLAPYRAGVTADGQRIISYNRGMTWLKVTSEAARGDYPGTAEEVSLPDNGLAYYQPATDTLKRRLDVIGEGVRVRLESNLPRERLIRVASSLPVGGQAIPRIVQRYGATTVERLDPELDESRFDFVRVPGGLPEGYKSSAALATSTRGKVDGVTVYYRRAEAEFAGDGIRITQAPGVDYLSPSARDSISVDVKGPALWTPGRGELEWIDDGVYRSVTVPLSDLGTAATIARSLR
ncbi:MAG: zf-HC2 domain-containing protein [Actinomycetota bacterium]